MKLSVRRDLRSYTYGCRRKEEYIRLDVTFRTYASIVPANFQITSSPPPPSSFHILRKTASSVIPSSAVLGISPSFFMSVTFDLSMSLNSFFIAFLFSICNSSCFYPSFTYPSLLTGFDSFVWKYYFLWVYPPFDICTSFLLPILFQRWKYPLTDLMSFWIVLCGF